jgi:hypothetical protein
LRAWDNYGGRAFREANTPDHPTYLLGPLDGQSPEWLETVATYARELAAWKRQRRQRELDERRAVEAINDTDREALDARGFTTHLDDPLKIIHIRIQNDGQWNPPCFRRSGGSGVILTSFPSLGLGV